MANGTAPILCAPLIRRVDEKLIELLRSLEPREWDLPTLVPQWAVRDVAAHLLDTASRKLSVLRDGCVAEKVEIRSSADLSALVHRMNREGVTVYRRLSPALLIDLLREVCVQAADFHEALDPFAPAAFGVSWAGESQSLNWFDTARELTERWHHQQQIREATDRPGILIPEFYFPVIDCFLRGLPYALRQVGAADGAQIVIEIGDDEWVLQYEAARWSFAARKGANCAARVSIPHAIAWRVFTRGIPFAEALACSRIEGDCALGQQVLRLTSIVT